MLPSPYLGHKNKTDYIALVRWRTPDNIRPDRFLYRPYLAGVVSRVDVVNLYRRQTVFVHTGADGTDQHVTYQMNVSRMQGDPLPHPGERIVFPAVYQHIFKMMGSNHYLVDSYLLPDRDHQPEVRTY